MGTGPRRDPQSRIGSTAWRGGSSCVADPTMHGGGQTFPCWPIVSARDRPRQSDRLRFVAGGAARFGRANALASAQLAV